MKVILASSTPITEEHTKLLDRLSEPSSQLIHRISHPPEEDIWPKLSLHVLSASGFTVLPVASLLSVKRDSLSSQLPRNCLTMLKCITTGDHHREFVAKLGLPDVP